jgi:TetR/AcrR family transcriptional repressor of nem operon
MPWSAQHSAETRERILAAAAAAFRSRGVDGTSVADVMSAAGLTHGGFYAHFDSKEDLLVEALQHTRRQNNERFENFESIGAIVDSYLSRSHMAHPEHGCSIPSIGPEIARGSAKARHRLAGGIRARIARLRQLLPSRVRDAERERTAMAAFACMVGGLVLARASAPADAERILAACRSFLHDQVD